MELSYCQNWSRNDITLITMTETTVDKCTVTDGVPPVVATVGLSVLSVSSISSTNSGAVVAATVKSYTWGRGNFISA